MKVLMINGSPRVDGNTGIALKEMEQVFCRKELKSKRYRSAIRRFVAVWPAVTVERTVSVCLMMW